MDKKIALLKMAREKLSANNMASGLPGRESQHEEIYNFLFERLKIRQTKAIKRAKVETGQVADIKGRHMNKSMFLCGVPGTGKTATVLTVADELQKLLHEKPSPIHQFETIYINGQYLASPQKIYSELLLRISGEFCNPDVAQEKLDKLFNDPGAYKPQGRTRNVTKVSDCYKLIIIDELDLLYEEKKQSVFYSLFDWPTSSDSKMLLITIANAMDLPERFMRGRLTSRLGWDKIVFESYTSDCLEHILKSRLEDLLEETFDKAAIIVATKRIGRTTGDARRILDTCRLAIDRAIHTNSSKVTTAIIDQVGFQNLDQHRLNYVLECPKLELLALKSIVSVVSNIGEDNVTVLEVYEAMHNYLKFATKPQWKNYIIGYNELYSVVTTLAAVGLIYLEHNKPLLKKHLYIKDSSDVFKDLIITTKMKI